MKCLLPQHADAFLDGIRKGEINPEKLSEMTSEARRDFIGKYVGEENAKFVNAQFESKLLLKNQKEGMITWAKTFSGLKPKAKSDLISKIEKLDKALSPEEQNKFLADIVEQRLGVQVTVEEAKVITDLTAKLKENYDNRTENGNPYGKYKQQLVEFMRDHTPPKQYPTTLDMAKGMSAEGLSVLRAIKTGFDLSASLRQGAAYFGTKQWNNAFARMFGYTRSKTALDELEASMYSNKYSDQVMEVKRDLGLTMLGESFTQREEAFSSKLIKNIPLLKNSERAYEGFLNDLRFNRFVDVMTQLDKAGSSIVGDKAAMKDLAKVIAAATGRGELGSFEQSAKALSTALFSPRFLVSRFQTILNPFTKTGVAQKEAALSLARVVGVSTSLIALAKMSGANVEDDPRSSDFGKIRVGDTAFDMTLGFGPYIVLLSRVAKGSTKSNRTGKITKLNEGGFGDQTKLDLIGSFISNKTSPVARVIMDYLQGKNIEGDKVSLDQPFENQMKYLADSLITPLLASDAIDAYNAAAGENKITMGAITALSSFSGVGVSTYERNPRGKAWDKIKETRGEEMYKQAVDAYNEKLDSELSKLKETDSYKNAPETSSEDVKESRASMIDKVKRRVTKLVLDKFD